MAAEDPKDEGLVRGPYGSVRASAIKQNNLLSLALCRTFCVILRNPI